MTARPPLHLPEFELRDVSLDLIHDHPENRTHTEAEIRTLADSIAAVDIQVPGIAYTDPTLPPGHVRLGDGHGRKAALKLLGRLTMPLLVSAVPLTRAQVAILMMTTGAIKSKLKPTQEAAQIRILMTEEGLDQVGVARRLGVSTSYVSNRLLLRYAHPAVQKAVDDNALNQSLGAELARKQRNLDKQLDLMREIQSLGLTRDAAVHFITRATGKGKAAKAPKTETLGTRFPRTQDGLNTLAEWAKGLVAGIEKVLRMDISVEAKITTITERFGLKGGAK